MPPAAIPNPDRAILDPAKVREYILSPHHPVGRHKAAVFEAAGYSPERWELLRADLLATARMMARAVTETPFGHQYYVDAILLPPGGRRLAVTVLWLVAHGEAIPRFITAYPRRRHAT